MEKRKRIYSLNLKFIFTKTYTLSRLMLRNARESIRDILFMGTGILDFLVHFLLLTDSTAIFKESRNNLLGNAK